MSDSLVDPDDLPADDRLWEDFYAMPIVLAQDPFVLAHEPLWDLEPALT
jgi:hypothetical protein